MRKRTRVRCLVYCLALMSLRTPFAHAEGGMDYSVEVSQKFGRGALNLLSSPLELPCGIRDEVVERGAAGVATGLFKGLVLFLRRALVGATEIGTFMIPMEATLPPVCASKPAPTVEAPRP